MSTEQIGISRDGGLGERWPMLGRAMGQYERKVAEGFSAKAYACVEAGLIRLEERKRLAREAEEMGIRAFDAQLLIACAVRQWAMDHRYEATPSKEAPVLSYEYKAWWGAWSRLCLLVAMTAVVEGIILWRWLGR